MSKKITLIIAVAMMLVAASNAYGYTELWTGGCGTGTLTYNGKDYTHGHGNFVGYIRDTTKTAGQRDTFDLYTTPGTLSSIMISTVPHPIALLS